MTVQVMHVMRTYGVHGGERQLAQLFSAFTHPEFKHRFCSLYRDAACEAYFNGVPDLEQMALMEFRARAFPSLLLELAFLLVSLPILQLRLLRALRKSDSRICVAHGFQGAMVVWLSALMLDQVRCVYVHRGTKSRLGKLAVFRLLYAPFDRVAGVSRASVDSLRSLVPERKLTVLENGIDWQAVDRAQPARSARKNNSPFVITCVGRLIEAKGQKLLLDAFALFQRAYPHSELWIVGDGPEEQALKQRADALAMTPHVKFLGHSAHVPELLAQSDLFSHASESEGLSNAVLEAMVLRLPSVVVDAPGVSECHVDGVTGYVVPRSAEVVAEKYALLIQSAERCANMGEAARDRACTYYSIQENCNRYARLYQALAS